MPTSAMLDGYQLHLPTFDGPLDVLLQMIERERLEISDVSLVAVTAGFLEYIEAMINPEPQLLVQFLGVASRLLLLKSRSLLPRRATDEASDEPDDLVGQLREYQRAKLIAGALREREQAGMRAHARPETAALGPINVVLIMPPVGDLRRALARAAGRVRAAPQVTQLRLQITIGEMIDRFRRRVAGGRAVSLSSVVVSGSRDEVVAGFIALLALWRRGEVDVAQPQAFGEIWIERATPREHSTSR